MHFALFYHSLISDWNHGNAHFLRGVASELVSQGHIVDVYEHENGWSLRNLREQQGVKSLEAFRKTYPELRSIHYDLATLDLDRALDGVDVCIVHEWNDPALVARIGERRRDGGKFKLLFHDTHHRAISAPDEIKAFDLRHYDGVLAFGEILRQIYEDRGWAAHAWTWHEAADVRRFKPPARRMQPELDVVWVGNWGDGERASEISEFLIEPVKALGLKACVYGVRYPADAIERLRAADITFGGWVSNVEVPQRFARAAMTVHIPRRFYRESLPGIPTIRIFEALACGTPLISAPWDDCEGLFQEGRDYLVAKNGREMREHMRLIRESPHAARTLAENGLRTILAAHTCAHRVSELLHICRVPSTKRKREAIPIDLSAKRSA